jgi:putative addiction module component (TIGR02574 family)
MSSQLTEEAKKLTVEERILLVEEIWNSIAEANECFELTEAQRHELDRRVKSFSVNPSRGRSWEEIKTEFLNSK